MLTLCCFKGCFPAYSLCANVQVFIKPPKLGDVCHHNTKSVTQLLKFCNSGLIKRAINKTYGGTLISGISSWKWHYYYYDEKGNSPTFTSSRVERDKFKTTQMTNNDFKSNKLWNKTHKLDGPARQRCSYFIFFRYLLSSWQKTGAMLCSLWLNLLWHCGCFVSSLLFPLQMGQTNPSVRLYVVTVDGSSITTELKPPDSFEKRY